MIRPPRQLSEDEVNALLARDLVATLATIDRDGFPHVTPIWFLWQDGAFWMTSFADRPHLKRLRHNPRAGIVVHVEADDRGDGERPNEQVRATGSALLEVDESHVWTQRIQEKYTRTDPRSSSNRRVEDRTLICLRPKRLVAVASV